ncbi:MAG: PQQ-binding-like beta-propeller repeat protein [Verrucomicrobiales bacterium]|nr:PQQ-binding-like beta-propeller repeat protein [Verrucomicrobiales bacterium]
MTPNPSTAVPPSVEMPIGPTNGPSRDKGGQGSGVSATRDPRPWWWIIGILGFFLVAVAAVMVWGQWIQPREEPWRSARLVEARERLLADPRNEALKTEIRELDRQLRIGFFRSLERHRVGAVLLMVAGIGLVLAARAAVSLAPRRDTLSPAPPVDRARMIRGSRLVAGLAGAVFIIAGGAAGLMSKSPLEIVSGPGASTNVGALTAVSVTPTWPTPEIMARQWPRFLGYDGSGVAGSAQLPLTWDAKAGSGVAWKTVVELEGYNSPVAWSNRVFLTGGDKKHRLVYCFDLETGERLWQRPVLPTNAPSPAIEPPSQSGQAASTAATDGRRVYAVFATGELGALDFEGRLVWSKHLDFAENGYGHASSLVVWRDRLLVQADQGQPEDGKSKIEALDSATGKVVWSAKRPVGGSWTTPVVIEQEGRNHILAGGDPWLIAYDLSTGTEQWRASVLGGELAPSPIRVGDRVIATSPGHAMTAVRWDGSGDVTKTHVVWRLEDGVPDVPTPVATADLLFTANTEGHLICREVSTGQQVWKHEFETEIQASPLMAGDRLYLFSQPGAGFVVQVAREFKQLATFEMGDEVYASPAVAGDRLLVRTKKSLVCIGPKPAERQVADAH